MPKVRVLFDNCNKQYSVNRRMSRYSRFKKKDETQDDVDVRCMEPLQPPYNRKIPNKGNKGMSLKNVVTELWRKQGIDIHSAASEHACRKPELFINRSRFPVKPCVKLTG